MFISIKCDGCGKEFQKQHWQVNKTRNFCCIDCKHQSDRTTIVCEECSKSFTKKKSMATESRRFCSRSCYLAWKVRAGRVVLCCAECGKVYNKQKWDVEPTYNCCSRKCHAEFQRKERSINGTGYVIIWVDDTKVLEHHYIVEQSLGRSLKEKEIVHHINGDRTDNRIENLQVMSQSQHVAIHNRTRQKLKNRNSPACQS